MCWASRAALCGAQASSRPACPCAMCATSQPSPEEVPGGCDVAELCAEHPFPGWSRLARQLPTESKSWEQSPHCQPAVSICVRSH